MQHSDTQTLSARLFSTPKTLERKFSALIGKTPAQYMKLIRFQATVDDMLLHKGMNFTDYAYRNGYADQSHFIRDFKAFSGFTPKEFAGKYQDSEAFNL